MKTLTQWINESNITQTERAYRGFIDAVKAKCAGKEGIDFSTIKVCKTTKGNWAVYNGDTKLCLVSPAILSDEIVDKYNLLCESEVAYLNEYKDALMTTEQTVEVSKEMIAEISKQNFVDYCDYTKFAGRRSFHGETSTIDLEVYFKGVKHLGDSDLGHVKIVLSGITGIMNVSANVCMADPQKYGVKAYLSEYIKKPRLKLRSYDDTKRFTTQLIKWLKEVYEIAIQKQKELNS